MTTRNQPMPIVANILATASGVILGIIMGVTGALLLATAMAGGNAFLVGLVVLFAGPIGLFGGAILGGRQARKMLRAWFQEVEGSHARARVARNACRLIFSSICVIFAMGATTAYLIKPPSDNRLLFHFERHEQTLNRVVQMLQTDQQLMGVDKTYTVPDNLQKIGVSAERLAEYRRLLEEAGTPRGFQVKDNGIHFYYWVTGSSFTSTTIVGFSYLSQPPSETVANLSQRPRSRVMYRHVRGKWYLFYHYYPG